MLDQVIFGFILVSDVRKGESKQLVFSVPL